MKIGKIVVLMLLVNVAGAQQLGPSFPYHVRLHWAPSVSPEVEAQYVYRAMVADCSPAGGFTEIASVPAHQGEFLDDSVARGPDQGYCYYVTSKDRRTGVHLASSRVHIKVPPLPPSNLSVTVTRISLSPPVWQAIFQWANSPNANPSGTALQSLVYCGPVTGGPYPTIVASAPSESPTATVYFNLLWGYPATYCVAGARSLSTGVSGPSNEVKLSLN